MTLCNPAIFYFILSIIIILIGISGKVQVSVYIIKLIWIVVLFYVLNFLCSKGYTTLSWILVLSPFIFIIFMILIILEISMPTSKKTNEPKINIVTLRDYLHSTKDDWNYITPIDFYNKYYLKKKDYFLIDLRSEKEYKKMHIKGSTNIFWLNILDEKNLKKLPKDKPIFLICYVGHTSSQVLTLLKMLGYNVISIKYGYGLSPVQGVPVAGWLDYGLPTEKS